jgi:predicted transcriptional regulator
MKRGNNKPKFSEVVTTALSTRGKSQAELAKELGVPETTVRQWVKRNVFPDEIVSEIAKRMGFPSNIEDLQTKFEFRIARARKASRTGARVVKQVVANVASTSVPEAFEILEQRVARFEPSTPTLGEDVIFYIKALSAGDALIYWSLDQVPYELRDGWALAGRAIAEGIKKGAFFLYVFPDANLLDELREKCGLRDLPSAESFIRYFNAFRERLIRKQSLKEAEVDNHVIWVTTNCSAFAAPGHKYVLYVPTNDVPRGVARYPTAGNQNFAVHLPLDPETTQQFHEFLIACLNTALKNLKADTDRDRREIIERLV